MKVSHTNTYVTHNGVQYRRCANDTGVHWWTDPGEGEQQYVSPPVAADLERAYQKVEEVPHE